LAALVTAVAGSALPRADCDGSEMGCGVTQSTTKRDFSGVGLSNAALLRRGLPLKNPVMRRGTPVRRTDPSAVPPTTPGTDHHRGIIAVTRLSDNSVLGYVSAASLSTGQFGYRDISSALIVDFDTPKTGPATQLNLGTENSDSGFTFAGLVQGRDSTSSNVAPGSFNYLYLAGTAPTSPGATPQSVPNSYHIGAPRTSESAVWTYDSGSGVLSPIWINTDGTTPPVQYFVQSGGIYIGGDSGAFHSRFPAPVDLVEFVFVSL